VQDAYNSLLCILGGVNESLFILIDVINPVYIFIGGRPPKQCQFKACGHLISCLEFIRNSSWDPGGIYINMKV
jgi:hypothetical protein